MSIEQRQLFLNSYCASIRHAARSTLFPYTTLFRSAAGGRRGVGGAGDPGGVKGGGIPSRRQLDRGSVAQGGVDAVDEFAGAEARSEEHTSELQSRENLVCRLLLEKKKK